MRKNPSAVRAEARRLGHAPVAGEEAWAAHLQLAGDALRRLAALVVHDPGLDARQRPSDRPRPPLALVGIAERDERLGHAVALEDLVAEALAERLEHLRGQRRRAAHEEPHARAETARQWLRPLEQPHVDRRHAEEERRPERLEERLRRVGLEARGEAHAAAAREPAADADAEAVHVEERQHREVAVRRGDAPGLDEPSRVSGEVAVSQDGALRAPGRTRGVDDRRGRRFVERDRRPVRRRGGRLGRHLLGGPDRHGRPSRGRVGGDEPDGLGVREHVAYFALPVEHVDRHEQRPELQAGEKQLQELEPVRQLHGQPVARAHAASRERVRRAIRQRLELAERDGRRLSAGRAELERGLAGARQERRIEELEQRTVHAPSVAQASSLIDSTRDGGVSPHGDKAKEFGYMVEAGMPAMR